MKKKEKSRKKEVKEKKDKKVPQVKPEWKNVTEPDYKEYFVTQAQLSRSIRKDGIAHLTFYDECIVPLQGKTKKPLVERRIKVKLIVPEKALERVAKFLSNVVEENRKQKPSEESTGIDEPVKQVKEERTKASDAQTSYIR